MNGIKVRVEEKQIERMPGSCVGSKYPCIKIAKAGSGTDRDIVLLTKLRNGIVIVGNRFNSFGYQSSSWDEEQLIPFHGKITIEVE